MLLVAYGAVVWLFVIRLYISRCSGRSLHQFSGRAGRGWFTLKLLRLHPSHANIMSTTTTSTTTFSLASYRYQEDAPGQIRPHVPKEEWRIHPVSLSSSSSSSLRVVIEITKKEDGSFCSVVLNVLEGDSRMSRGAVTSLVGHLFHIAMLMVLRMSRRGLIFSISRRMTFRRTHRL
jgi:hypothetical protein